MDVGGLLPPHTHLNTRTNEMRNRAVHVGDRVLNRGEAAPPICLCQASWLLLPVRPSQMEACRNLAHLRARARWEKAQRAT